MVAMERWPEDGTPDNPAGWILTTARNRAIDLLRRDKRLAEKRELLRRDAEPAHEDPEMDEFPDDRLRLIFTCCHPALAPEARVALTLRTLGGLTTPEIARAFLVAEPAMAQRIVRAKRKIRDGGHPLRGARGARAARPAALRARRALPRVQRGLRRQLRRRAGAARALRRGDPAGRRARRADARRGRGARAGRADAAAGLAPRRPRGRRRLDGPARGPGPGALGARRRSPPAWSCAAARWRSRRPGATRSRPRSRRSTRAPSARRTPTGTGSPSCTRCSTGSSPLRSSGSIARRRSRWPRAPSGGWR